MHKDRLVTLRNRIFSGESSKDVIEEAEKCLYEILENYDHSRMIIFTRLVDMLAEKDGMNMKNILSVVDIVRFPVKKSIGEERGEE